MTPADALLTYAILGLPAGLALGMMLGLVARFEDGWGGYGSFRRRAARLAHVAAVMLPLIAGFYALALGAHPEGLEAAWLGAWLWIAGGIGLPVVLAVAAWRPRLKLALPAPATAVVCGAVAFAVSHLSG
jgi:hypothetical protein